MTQPPPIKPIEQFVDIEQIQTEIQQAKKTLKLLSDDQLSPLAKKLDHYRPQLK